jgi:hypothetical protein
VACALNCLSSKAAGQLAHKQPLRQELTALRAFVDQLLSAASQQLPSIDAGTAAALLHSLASLANTGKVRCMCCACCACRVLCVLCWAVAVGRQHHCQLSWKPRSLCRCSSAYASSHSELWYAVVCCGVQVPAAYARELVGSLLLHVQPLLSSLSPSQLTQMVWALKQLQHTPSEVRTGVVRCVVCPVAAGGGCRSALHSSSASHCIAEQFSQGVAVPPYWLCAPLLLYLVGLADLLLVPCLHVCALCCVLWCAPVKCRPGVCPSTARRSSSCSS